jgi:hypothetical protein
MVLGLTTAWLLAAGSLAHAQTLLRWKFKPGETLHYVLTQQLIEKAQLIGKTPTTMTMGLSYDDVWKIDSVDKEGVATINRTIDRIQIKLQGPQGVIVDYDTASGKEPTGMAKIFAPIATAIVKKVAILRINQRGEILEAKPPQGLLESVEKILPGVGSFGDIFSAEGLKKMQVNIQFPEEPVTKGKTWTTKQDLQVPVVLGTVDIDQKYEYLGTERREGIDLERIAISVVMASDKEKHDEKNHRGEKHSEEEPSEQKMAAPLVKLKANDSSGAIYFDNAQGRISESNMKMKLQAEINAIGKKGTLDIEGTLRMKLQPANGVEENQTP